MWWVRTKLLLQFGIQPKPLSQVCPSTSDIPFMGERGLPTSVVKRDI
jgi:hypothetical protein